MASNYVQDGQVIDYLAGGTITSNQVVAIGNVLGVALTNIASGKTGSVALSGVFTVPKVTAAVIAQGDALTWDASAAKTLKVRFTGVPGTLT